MITGGIKFFEPNLALARDGATAVASTGTLTDENPLDRNPLTVWRSVGSDDMTTETWTITFAADVTFNRLFLLNHNFKEFDIQYDDSGWTDFANVVSLDDATPGTGIAETDWDKSVSYYEFDTVTTDQVRIRIDTTQTADAEKFLAEFVATLELGTLSGYPKVSPVRVSRNARVATLLTGRSRVRKSIQTFAVNLDLDPYPAAYGTDLDLLMSLTDRDDDFLVWLCGGRYGSTYFTTTLRGFRLADLLLMQIGEDIENEYNGNIYVGPVRTGFSLIEVA